MTNLDQLHNSLLPEVMAVELFADSKQQAIDILMAISDPRNAMIRGFVVAQLADLEADAPMHKEYFQYLVFRAYAIASDVFKIVSYQEEKPTSTIPTRAEYVANYVERIIQANFDKKINLKSVLENA